jgi:hypothetical protein
MGLFGDLCGVVGDVASVVVAPVAVVASAAKEVTGSVAKEVAEVVTDLKNDIKRGY